MLVQFNSLFSYECRVCQRSDDFTLFYSLAISTYQVHAVLRSCIPGEGGEAGVDSADNPESRAHHAGGVALGGEVGAEDRVQEGEAGRHEDGAQQESGRNGVGDNGYEGRVRLVLIIHLAMLICVHM